MLFFSEENHKKACFICREPHDHLWKVSVEFCILCRHGNEGDVDDLIERAKQRDQNAFATLIERYLYVIEAVIRKFIRNIVEHEEDDIVKMVVMWAWEKIPTLQDDERGFKAWIGQKTRFTCLDILKAQKERGIHVSVDDDETGVNPQDPAPGSLDMMMESEKEAAFRSALQALPDDFRAVVSLRYEGLSYKEIVEICGIPIKTVGSRLNRAIKMIRENLKQQGILE